MQILLNTGEGMETSEALESHVRDKLEGVDRRFGDRLTRIEIYLKDVNAGKGGVDTACTMEARPRGLEPLVVEADAEDAYTATHEAARRLERALESRLGRKRDER